MKVKLLILTFIFFISCMESGQNSQDISSNKFLNSKWVNVANNMPMEWYGSDQAKLIAENVILCQKDIGGWAKNKAFHHTFTDLEKAEYLKSKSEKGGTFDNNATITELRFLAKVYSNFGDERYKQAFEKGLNYIFIAQYENGGWPQFFPVRDSMDEVNTDHTVPYSMHITYNDNAMVNVMRFLQDIFSNNKDFESLQINKEQKLKAKDAFNKGIQCILNTQIIDDGKPSVWCAQHNAKTLAPANARAYELASFSGSESVNIVLLLMSIENPSPEIIASINGALLWFEKHKINGIRIETTKSENGEKNRAIIEDENAPPLWARFYDLETGAPFFCSRDGIKRKSLTEISDERRNGYGWYTDKPALLFALYPEWKKKNNLN